MNTPNPKPVVRLCCRCRTAPAGKSFPPLCPKCAKVREREDAQDRRIAERFNPAGTPPELF